MLLAASVSDQRPMDQLAGATPLALGQLGGQGSGAPTSAIAAGSRDYVSDCPGVGCSTASVSWAANCQGGFADP